MHTTDNAPLPKSGHQGEPFLYQDTSVEGRMNYLGGLDIAGWEDQALLEEVITLTAYSGVRLDNYRSLRYVAAPAPDQAVAAMEWDHGKGELRTFLLYAQSAGLLTRLRLNIHEGGHAGSPANPANAGYFGGEEGRLKACAYNWKVMDQCLMTDEYLSPYHEKLAKQYKDGEIDERCLWEETWAIHLELSLLYSFKRWLAQSEANQSRRLAVLQHKNLGVDYPPPVKLGINWDNDESLGLGEHLVHGALYGVHDQASLKAHIRALNEARWAELKRYDTGRPMLERMVGSLAAVCTRVNTSLGNGYDDDNSEAAP